MNYQQKIIPDGGGYKGLLIANGEVIYTSERCSTLKEAADKIRNQMPRQSTVSTNKQVINKAPLSFSYNPPASVSPRRCCGR